MKQMIRMKEIYIEREIDRKRQEREEREGESEWESDLE